jgi:hypothetical protein
MSRELIDNSRGKNVRPENAFVKQIFDKNTGRALLCRVVMEPEVSQSFGVNHFSLERIDYEVVMKAVVGALRLEKKKALAALEWVSSDVGIRERERRKDKLSKAAKQILEQVETGGEDEAFFEQLSEKEKDFETLMEQVEALELAFSVKNPWILLYADIEVPDRLTKAQARKWIDRVLVEDMVSVEVTFPEEYLQWREYLPEESFD